MNGPQGNSPGDRRPLATRELAISQRAAALLIERQVSPNAVSLAGMAAAALAGLAFSATVWLPTAALPLWLVGALLVQLRLLANMLDGMVAVGRGIASPVGELYNDAPDRFADAAILSGVGIAGGNLALGLLAALMAVATAYVRILGKSVGAPSDFRGPMAKPQRMALITALAVIAGFLPLAWQGGLIAAALWAIVLLAALTTARRLHAAARFLRQARAA